MPLGTEVGLGQSDIVLDEDFFGEDPNFRAVNSNGLTHRPKFGMITRIGPLDSFAPLHSEF